MLGTGATFLVLFLKTPGEAQPRHPVSWDAAGI